MYHQFYPSEFWKRYDLKEKTWNTVIDTRTANEYEAGHYKGAIHWPADTVTHQNIHDRLHEIKSPVLIYDNNGDNSMKWKDKFKLILEEMNIDGYFIAYTDAHWT